VERVPFAHPLWVLFTSGTTGRPKPIVHGHGGIALEFFKSLALQSDLRPRDRFFWYSTTGWMMWNHLIGGLIAGATIVLYDGNPAGHRMSALWRLAGDFGVTFFGVSAPYLMACRKAGVVPADHCDPAGIREVGSTGAPLPAEGFAWLTDQLGEQVRVNSLSGGTDVCTAFAGGVPWLPIRPGEISGSALGCRVEAWGPSGRPVLGEVGELVVTAPMPSMPVFLWGDESGERYRSSYFAPWPGTWRHGDWVRIDPDGSMVISGRSDATLNRGGVRLGTAEFYRVVEDLDSIADSLVVHLEDDGGGAGELILFVLPAAGVAFDDALVAEVGAALRRELSPRHVPDRVYPAGTIPRTLSGKKLEVPVKKILLGAEPREVSDPDSLVDPASLDQFVALRRG
ncbi:MAG: AMP-binding protein, partial [Nocardioides sp.]